MTRSLERMTWPQAELAMTPTRPVIVPLGSTEQHGPHMALSTDTVMASEWAARLAERIDGLYLPTLPFGQVWSARHFPGTIGLTTETLESSLTDISESLYRHGTRRIVFLSGHMGNTQGMLAVARRLLDTHPDLRTVRICYPNARQVAEGITESPFWDGGNFHAAEIETSLMLAVAPDLCHMADAPREYPEVPDDYHTGVVPWRQFSRTGVFGDASVATAEKGHRLIEKWLEVMATLISKGFETKG